MDPEKKDGWFLGGLFAAVAAGLWLLHVRRRNSGPPAVEVAKHKIYDAPAYTIHDPVPHAIDRLEGR